MLALLRNPDVMAKENKQPLAVTISTLFLFPTILTGLVIRLTGVWCSRRLQGNISQKITTFLCSSQCNMMKHMLIAMVH
jgi:hypothetical protein